MRTEAWGKFGMPTRIGDGRNFAGYTHQDAGEISNAYAHLNLVKAKCRIPTLQNHYNLSMGEILTRKLQLYYAQFDLDIYGKPAIISYN